MKKILLSTTLLLIWTLATSQKDVETFNLEYDVSSLQKVRIHNYDGDVKVTARPGNKVSLKVTRTLMAKTNSKLEAAKQEVYLDSTVIDGELIVFMKAPQKFFKIDDEGNSYYNGQNWNNWSKGDIRDYGVDYEFIIEAQIPPNKEIYIATHHEDVDVSGFLNRTVVKSHHGSVKASTSGKEVIAKSHHGDVTVEHLSDQVNSGYYKTHHGDINTSFPSLSVLASMKSHHGAFYSDFDFQHVAQKVSVNEDGGETKYKYGGETNIKIGGGKGVLRYQTHHGDTYIVKN